MQTTESIDRLFLELSQFTQATTAKELELVQERDALRLMAVRYKDEIDALRAERDAAMLDTERLNLLSDPTWRVVFHKRRWAVQRGFTNYEYETHATLRAAIDATRAEQK